MKLLFWLKLLIPLSLCNSISPLSWSKTKFQDESFVLGLTIDLRQCSSFSDTISFYSLNSRPFSYRLPSQNTKVQLDNFAVFLPSKSHFSDMAALQYFYRQLSDLGQHKRKTFIISLFILFLYKGDLLIVSWSYCFPIFKLR